MGIQFVVHGLLMVINLQVVLGFQKRCSGCRLDSDSLDPFQFFNESVKMN